MSGKIRLSKSSISKAEKEAVLRVLDKEYLGMVKLFEEKIKNYLETSMDVSTSALHLALSALGVKEVLVPSLLLLLEQSLYHVKLIQTPFLLI